MVYLDTSVAVALFIPEANMARIKKWFAAAPDLIVSADWIVTEFASALSIKQRRGDITAPLARGEAGIRYIPRRRIASCAGNPKRIRKRGTHDPRCRQRLALW